MKQFKTNTLILLLILTWLISFATALAESPRIYLSAEGIELTAGQEFTVDVLVENIPPIYGADVRLLFSPAEVEVVGISDGDFIDAENSFFLQNEFNNEDGSIDYALALVNPAPDAAGNGRLLTITFLAKSDGATELRIQEGEFGTRTGELVALIQEGVELAIAPELVSTPVADETEDRGEDNPQIERSEGTEETEVESPPSIQEAIDSRILIIAGVLGGVLLMLLLQLGLRRLR